MIELKYAHFRKRREAIFDWKIDQRPEYQAQWTNYYNNQRQNNFIKDSHNQADLTEHYYDQLYFDDYYKNHLTSYGIENKQIVISQLDRSLVSLYV